MPRGAPEPDYPLIRDVGLTGMLVTFAAEFGEPANRAALAFRAAIEREGWEGVQETASSLASAFVAYDPLQLDRDDLQGRLTALARDRDWRAADLPPGRRHLRIPVALGGAHGPQFHEAADLAGLSPEAARDSIGRARIRVLTIGFAPGQAYLGQLEAAWDVPRMKKLNPKVPACALVVAIRQLIIFGRAAPTGWRHIGQTAFQSYRPGSDRPFGLSLGDEVSFRLVEADELEEIRAADGTGDGGAEIEEIA